MQIKIETKCRFNRALDDLGRNEYISDDEPEQYPLNQFGAICIKHSRFSDGKTKWDKEVSPINGRLMSTEEQAEVDAVCDFLIAEYVEATDGMKKMERFCAAHPRSLTREDRVVILSTEGHHVWLGAENTFYIHGEHMNFEMQVEANRNYNEIHLRYFTKRKGKEEFRHKGFLFERECKFKKVWDKTAPGKDALGSTEYPVKQIGYLRADHDTYRWHCTYMPVNDDLKTPAVRDEMNGISGSLIEGTFKGATGRDVLFALCDDFPQAASKDDPTAFTFYHHGKHVNFMLRLYKRVNDYQLYLHSFVK